MTPSNRKYNQIDCHPCAAVLSDITSMLHNWDLTQTEADKLARQKVAGSMIALLARLRAPSVSIFLLCLAPARKPPSVKVWDFSPRKALVFH